MKVINFFGAPCEGKSTLAMDVAQQMKKKGMRCEYVSEVAKDYIWEDKQHLMHLQNLILAQQEAKLNVLKNKIDWVVVDSPLLHSAFYAPSYYPEEFTKLCLFFFNQYDNINFFVRSHYTYDNIGRVEDERQAKQKSMEMENFLKRHQINFNLIDGADFIFEDWWLKIKSS